ncbi:MAG: aminotransferase class I/II-fold pyridoxal phosphate-dependent enzyme [Desulfitobacteriaceae bacterium]|nr:aminotransferase class I/II-fold pyridoxal phosphate-dependent enzyme [Desulfitobacteriaceae bacterium]
MHNKQMKAPIFDALKKYISENTIPFHVPGHKQGRGLPEFVDFVGENVLKMDLTCLPDTDNICNAVGAIKEAENLAAELYGADKAFFLVNGTTSGIQSMIMSVCQPGDKIILPRNVHKSALGGLILSGAVPIYIEPELDPEFGITMCLTPDSVENTLRRNPDAKAVFLVYPIYYGLVSDLEKICQVAHEYGVPVIVDEAHGAHLKFHQDLPISSIEAGADVVASSTHKLLGSMSQTSILLVREGLISASKVKAVMNLTQTTSPSYVLLTSLDLARRQMALKGSDLMSTVLELSWWVRREINQMRGYKLLGENVVGKYGCVGFDPAKITVNVAELGMSGYQMESLLRSRYQIQVELSDLYNVIFLITVGDNRGTIGKLLTALKEISLNSALDKVIRYLPPLPKIPEVEISPRDAFYHKTKAVPFEESAGEISAEGIMAYPPGIPLICPGEKITQEIVDYVRILKQENAELQGTEDHSLETIKVIVIHLAWVNNEEIADVG